MSSKKLSFLFATDATETRKNLLRHYRVDLPPWLLAILSYAYNLAIADLKLSSAKLYIIDKCESFR